MATDLRFFPSKKDMKDLRTILFAEKAFVIVSNPVRKKDILKEDAYRNPYLKLNKRINTDYNVIFAKGTIDFTQYKITRGNIYIETNLIASHGKIIVPKTSAIRIIVNPSLALVRSSPGNKILTPFKTNIFKTRNYSHDKDAITIKVNIAFALLDIIEK
ncbi:MAG: hypothetical protein AAF518_19645 [Spirochaetota bacterium]